MSDLFEGFLFDISASGKTLTIKGAGAIPECDLTEEYPWYALAAYVDRIIISEGITELPCGSICSANAAYVKLPDSLTTIKAGAFEAMKSLKKIKLGKNVQHIDSRFFFSEYGAFDGSEPFCAVEVDSDNPYYTSKGGVLFTKDLKSLIRFPIGKTIRRGTYRIPDGVETIEPGAFAWTGDALRTVIMPETVVLLGKGAFANSSIKKVTLSKNLSEIPDDSFSCTPLKDISIPTSVKRIGEWAFSHSEISKVKIPVGVESIGAYAFHNSQLQQISLPSTLKYVGECAFSELIDEEGYDTDDLVVTGAFYYKFDPSKVTIVNEGNEKFLYAMRRKWKVWYSYGSDGGMSDVESFYLNCSDEEFSALHNLMMRSEDECNPKIVSELQTFLKRVEQEIEDLIKLANTRSYAFWILYDDGYVRYKLANIDWIGSM